jgi:DNA-binding ferritin-like protein
MDDKKEYIQISREDFKVIYKLIDSIKKSIKRSINDLGIVNGILINSLNTLENVLNKNVIKDINKTEININMVIFSLKQNYYILRKDIKSILEKIKKEQINENIQISKKEFKKIYKIINQILKSLKKDTNLLKNTHKILINYENLLEIILNKNIIKNLIKARVYVKVTMSSLTYYYIILKEDIKNILKKAKNEQIDKNNG